MPRSRLSPSELFYHNRQVVAEARAYEEGYEDGYRTAREEFEVRPFVGGRPELAPRGNPHPKKRRKTAYQSAYSAAYKRLKKKHPRMSFGSLSKKAHAAARKKVK